MRTRRSTLTTSLCLLFTPTALGQAGSRPQGPDAVVASVYDARALGTATVDGEIWRSFSVGAEVWNVGDRPLAWDGSTANHVVIAQNLYRSDGHRFRQLGLGWIKHVVTSANLPADPQYGPCIPVGYAYLGVNCADVYGSQQNAGPGGLGPRFDLNPTTGTFSMPYASLAPPATPGDPLARRIAVRDGELQAAAGAAWYAEAAVYGPDECAWGNGQNGFAARMLLMPPSYTGTQQPLAFAGTGSSTTAIEFWVAATPGVQLAQAQVHERNTTVLDKWEPYQTGDTSAAPLPPDLWVSRNRLAVTRFIAAGAADENEDGTWTYRLAVMNVDSHRAVSAVRLRLPANAAVSSPAFWAPAYHSGDRVRNVPWSFARTTAGLQWAADTATEVRTLPSVGDVVFEPNTLRYATVYTFEFSADAPPAPGSLRLDLWRPPADTAGFQGSSISISNLPLPRTCAADVGGTGGAGAPDGQLDNNDFVVFIDAFFSRDALVADVGSTGALAQPDNEFDNNDFVVFIDSFFTGCF